jgi:cell division protein FtsB
LVNNLHQTENQDIKAMMQNFISSGKKALAIAGLIVLAYLILDLNHRVSDLVRITSERDTMATEVYNIQQTEQVLQTQIAYANSDAAVEKWAREDAFMARPGEHPIVMLPDDKYTPSPEPTQQVTQEVLQNWQIWSELFFSR